MSVSVGVAARQSAADDTCSRSQPALDLTGRCSVRAEMSGLWIFGYGSLVWNPGFEYSEAKIGYIRGYSRKFWQGNDVQRGTADRPGRVATLIPDDQSLTWGKAFLLKDENCASSLAYLENREGKLGGYSTSFVQFQPRDHKENPFPVLLYIAQANNPQYLGPGPLQEIANIIASSKGACGHNVEYLMRLAHFMRECVADYWDDHLFTLERLVKAKLKEDNIPLKSLMGDWDVFAETELLREPQQEESPTSSRRIDFSSAIPSRKLRCLDI